MNITDLTTTQLRQIMAVKEKIEKLQSQLDSISGGEIPTAANPVARRKRRMSSAAKARIAAAQKARWAKLKGNAKSKPARRKRKYHMSAAHRRKLIKALAKARKIRWAKAKSQPAKKDRRSSPSTRAKLAAAAKARWEEDSVRVRE